MADAYHSAQNFAHEFRAALREARAINGAVAFEEEIIVPRPPVRDGLASGRFAVSASTDGLVWGAYHGHIQKNSVVDLVALRASPAELQKRLAYSRLCERSSG